MRRLVAAEHEHGDTPRVEHEQEAQLVGRDGDAQLLEAANARAGDPVDERPAERRPGLLEGSNRRRRPGSAGLRRAPPAIPRIRR
jgi:hypothetical protein